MLDNYSSWAERNGFPDWSLALFWIVFAFISFQLLATVVFVLLFVSQAGSGISIGALTNLAVQNINLLFIANSTGQILCLGLATWFFCRLQTSKYARTLFLRLQANKKTILCTGIALLSVICIQPFIMFLGWLNSFLPFPKVFDSLQMQQMNMLQQYLTGSNLTLLVFFHVALVPAICEEILFRGYMLRSLQNNWGYIAAILITGVIFGLYHLRLTHFLPLAAIGILLGYLTWVSESIVPAVAAHFLNNAGSVFIVRFFPNSEMATTSTEMLPPIWLIVASIAITTYFLYYLFKYRQSSIVNSM